MHDVKGHVRNGRWVRPHRRRNPGGQAGGSGPSGNGTTVVLLITVTLALGGGGYLAFHEVAGVGGSKASTAGRAPSSKVKVSAEAQAGFRRAEATLVASGNKTKLAVKYETDCAAHSYGRVRTFFRSNPCTSLSRAYIQIGDSELLVAISWVQMPDTSSAESYKRLVDTPGAGNVTELSRETTLYKNIKYTDGAHTSGFHGTAVWNVQVQPVFPRPPEVVDKILADSRQ